MLSLSRPAPSTLLAALAVVLLGLSLSACSSSRDATRSDVARGGDDRVERHLASLVEAVDLTVAQTERVREILVAQEANRPSGPPPQGGRGGQGGPPPGDRDARRAEIDRQIEAVLTEAQVGAFRQWQASQPQRPQGPPPRGEETP